MRKRYVIYIIDHRWDTDDLKLDSRIRKMILIGPGDVLWYPYEEEGYETEEKAVEAIKDDSLEKHVIFPVYSWE